MSLDVYFVSLLGAVIPTKVFGLFVLLLSCYMNVLSIASGLVGHTCFSATPVAGSMHGRAGAWFACALIQKKGVSGHHSTQILTVASGETLQSDGFCTGRREGQSLL